MSNKNFPLTDDFQAKKILDCTFLAFRNASWRPWQWLWNEEYV